MVDPPAPKADECHGLDAATCDLAGLVREHHAALYRYAFRLSGCESEAEDLTQQTFVIALQKLHQVRQANKIRNWLYTVLRNCYLKTRRKPVAFSSGSHEVDIESFPEEQVEDGVDRELLQAALNELPDEFKLVLVMFYFEDRSYKEIAAALEIKIGTVMSRLSRAKNHLRGKLLAGSTTAVETRSDNGHAKRPWPRPQQPRPGVHK